jgi:methylmalonyl-CoA mutase C-terminal domain/subunit
VRELLDAEGAEQILITGGGIIPAADMAALREAGIGELFGPGTRTADVVAYIREWCARRDRGVVSR